MKENLRHPREFHESDPQAKQIRDVCLAALEMLSEILWTHPTGRFRYYAVLEMLDGALINLGISTGDRLQMVLDPSLVNFAAETTAELGKNAIAVHSFSSEKFIATDADAAEVAAWIAGEFSNWLGRLSELTSDAELAAAIDLFYQFFDAQTPENKV